MATQFNPKSNKAKSGKPEPAPAPAPVAKPAFKAAKPAVKRDPTPEEIGVRAFEIYVSEGCQEGNDLDHWLRAEKELRSQSGR
jgi:hypothetical protein